MNPKEINRESGRIFKSLLMPYLADRSQEDQEDYGVDFEIELIAPEDKATGVIFKVQLKGTSIAKYDESGWLVFSEASVERFKYYINELRIPLIFVVCDVITGACYWTRVHGNRHLELALNDAAAKDQKTFTIKLAASRKVLKTTESAGEIVEAVGAAMDTITLRGLQSISPVSVREHIGHEPDIEVVERRFRLCAGIAANESIRKMIQSGDFEGASKKAESIFESASETPEVRILGGLSLAHTYNVQFRRSCAPDAAINAAKVKLGIASRMLGVARQKGCETKMKRYVRIYTRAARMHINGRVSMALAVSENIQRHQEETFFGSIVYLRRVEISALVAKDFFSLRDALYRLGNGGFFSVMPYALVEISESILPYVSALRILGRNDLAEAYVNALFDFLPFSVGIIRRFEDAGDIAEILTSLGIRFVGLADASDSSSMPRLLTRYEDALKGEPEFSCRDKVVSGLRALVDEVQTDAKVKKVPSMEEARAYYAQQAAELGIDLNDPNDDFAKIVRIGIADLDPTRVLKNCEHIYVAVGSYGLPAEMLGLHTAGSKRVVCLKHGHSAESLKLDSAYRTFAKISPWDKDQICCENCPDTVPHPDGWELTDEWNIRQHAKYLELVNGLEPEA
jgi:hypothetical protein